MASEHNPIAGLISQIQQQWKKEASPFPQIKLFRWLIHPQDARLFEGFLKLEATPHGKVPEAMITLLTPFANELDYSIELIKDWSKQYIEDSKKYSIEKNGSVFSKWSPAKYQQLARALTYDTGDELLIDMLNDFQQSVLGETRLALILLPHSIKDMEGFKRWMKTIVKKNIPPAICFTIFDHYEANQFDIFFAENFDNTKTLYAELDLDGAIHKITKQGNPNDPEVKLRECILEMGKAAQFKNESKLHEWGTKALEVTQKSGNKGLLASACIIYAGMLFNFKDFQKIDELLAKGLQIAHKGAHLNDPACPPLVIQFHGFIAASNHQQKKYIAALTAYEKQGDLSCEAQTPGMALTPYYQAYKLSERIETDRYQELIEKAFNTGLRLSKEELVYSNFVNIANDFITGLEQQTKWGEAQTAEQKVKALLGEDWKLLLEKKELQQNPAP